MPAHFLNIFYGFNQNVRLYLITSALFGFILFGGIYPLLFNLYLLRLGFGTEFIGLASATGAMSFAVFCLPSGFLGGRWGSRLIMIVGVSIAMIGYGLLSQAELIPPAFQRPFIVATYSIGVIGIALFVVNGMPYLMAITDKEERNQVFSVQAALLPFSGFFGSLLAGFLPGRLADFLNLSLDHPSVYRYTLFIGAMLLLLGVVAMMKTHEVRVESKQQTLSEAGPLPLALIFITSFISLLHMAGEASARTFFNVYMDEGLHVNLSRIGAQQAGAQLLGVPAALALPFLSARFGNRRTIIGGTAATALFLVPMALIPSWPVVGLCYMCIMALAALRRVAFAIFHQELVPECWRTAMSGTASMMSGLGYSATSFGGGYLILTAGYASLFMTTAAITGFGSLLFWIYFRKSDP